ncbi:MAG: dipeptide epimerase [Chloroflexi bacterium]|nr:dipeptide epimerase [Chloroflexota bacterium]
MQPADPQVVPCLSWQSLTLQLRVPFRLSYGATQERTAHWIRLREDAGWGEGTIPPYYPVREIELQAYWDRTALRTEPFPERFEQISDWVNPDGPGPARAAVDIALHDYISRKLGLPLHAALNLPAPVNKASSFTISVDTPESMAAEARRLDRFPILKLKVAGDEEDMPRLEAVRAARPDARLFADANAGWSLTQALEYLPYLENANLEVLEQPLGAGEIEAMGEIQAKTRIALVADESLQKPEDLRRLAGAGVRGVNIKLMKVGGLGPALDLMKQARKAGMKIMLGCMIETAVGLTAAAHLAGLADWLDLDACLLVANDPFEGMRFGDDALISLPQRPGIGARLRQSAA